MSQNQISHKGIVNKLDKEFIYVSIVSEAACAGCKSKHICGIVDNNNKILKIPRIGNMFATGDEVVVTISQSVGNLAVLFAYVIPFILIMAVLIIFYLLNVSELIMGAVVLLSLAFYFLVLYLFREKLNQKIVFKISKA